MTHILFTSKIRCTYNLLFTSLYTQKTMTVLKITMDSKYEFKKLRA